MAITSEIVEDWLDLTKQISNHSATPGYEESCLIAAILILARELKWYRQWAEEHHST